MRLDEQFAVRAFDGFLDKVGSAPALWSPGDEPPDRYLTVHGEKFAVEITEVMESVHLGNGSMPDRGVNAALLRFASEVESEAIKQRILSGQYLMSLEPIPRMAVHRDRLLTAALEYIGETVRLDVAEDALLESFENGAMIHIKKVSPKGQAVLHMTGPADAKWGGQIMHDISTLVPAAIALKSAKLANISLPKILLLIDGYVYARAEEWEASVNWAGRHSFHTIARVHSERQCQVLFSRDARWSAAA
ncbi:MAG: hypothetical protein ABR998_10575 [Gemmatimonadales bacterium]|jgi:hypothetical protein